MKKSKKPWPTKDVMTQIYAENLWGRGDGLFYSGEGSHLTEIIYPYIDCVKKFLSSFEEKLTVVDLGCGDFNIGKELVNFSKKYIGIDIVESLINHNLAKFSIENLEFQCLDIAVDPFPKGDCVILRQVLQHLSNDEINRIVEKLKDYKYVIITEHIPLSKFTPNIDKISSQGIRLKKKSGVNVLAPPFNFSIKSKKELHSYVLEGGKGIIKTILYTIY